MKEDDEEKDGVTTEMQIEKWHGPNMGESILPPSHPPEESPLALKSKTRINDLDRARRSHKYMVIVTKLQQMSVRRRRQHKVSTLLI